MTLGLPGIWLGGASTDWLGWPVNRGVCTNVLSQLCDPSKWFNILKDLLRWEPRVWAVLGQSCFFSFLSLKYLESSPTQHRRHAPGDQTQAIALKVPM